MKKQTLLAGIALSFSLGTSAKSLDADCQIVDPADHWIAYEKLSSVEAEKFLGEAWEQGLWGYVSTPDDYWVIDIGKRIAYASGDSKTESVGIEEVSDGRIFGKSRAGTSFELDRASGRLKITKHQPKRDVILRGIAIGTTSTWTYQCSVSPGA